MPVRIVEQLTENQATAPANALYPATQQHPALPKRSRHRHIQAIVDVAPRRRRIEELGRPRRPMPEAAAAHDEIAVAMPVEERRTLIRVQHGLLATTRGEMVADARPGAVDAVRLPGAAATVHRQPPAPIDIHARILRRVDDLVRRREMDAVLTDGIGGPRRIAPLQLALIQSRHAPAMRRRALAHQRRRRALRRYRPARVPAMHEQIAPPMKRHRPRADGLPGTIQLEQRPTVRPMHQIPADQLAEDVCPAAPAAAVMMTVQQIQHMEHAVVPVEHHIAYPGVEASGRVELNLASPGLTALLTPQTAHLHAHLQTHEGLRDRHRPRALLPSRHPHGIVRVHLLAVHQPAQCHTIVQHRQLNARTLLQQPVRNTHAHPLPGARTQPPTRRIVRKVLTHHAQLHRQSAATTIRLLPHPQILAPAPADV